MLLLLLLSYAITTIVALIDITAIVAYSITTMVFVDGKLELILKVSSYTDVMDRLLYR